MANEPEPPTDAGAAGLAERAVQRFLSDYACGPESLEAYWSGVTETGADLSVLCRLIKADLQRRFELGEFPSAAEYLDRFPALQSDKNRVLSLAYHEFYIRETQGEEVDLDDFLGCYEPWRESLASQLNYHRDLSNRFADPKFPEVGELFEQFKIVAELGRGGAAHVFLAEDLSLANRQVVLKVSLDRGSEHEVLAMLRHPHIVPVFTVNFLADSLLRGLCIEYRPGLALDEVLRRLHAGKPPKSASAIWQALQTLPTPPPLRTDELARDGEGEASPAEGPPKPLRVQAGATGWADFPVQGSYAQGVAWIGAVLADALHYAHQRKIVHRDVKPANVLLTYADGPQLLDFNLAEGPELASNALAALRGGTLPYMSPEQLEAFRDPKRWTEVGAASDVYSMGMLLREMITGRPPDSPKGAISIPRVLEILLQQRRELTARIRSEAPETPHALEAVVAQCLAYDPAGRYVDAGKLAEDLRQVAARAPLRHAVNRSTRERCKDWWFRGRRRAAVVSAVLLVTVASLMAWNYERWFVKIGDRRDFQRAVRAIEDGRPEGAVALLGPLEALAPDDSVVRYYRGVALTQLESPEPAAVELNAALRTPQGRRAVLLHGRERAGFAKLASETGLRLLRLVPPRPAPGEDWEDVLEASSSTLDLALSLQPLDADSLKGKANLAERRNDYQEAVRILTRTIEGPVAGELGPGDRSILFANRARVVVRWVSSSFDPDLANPQEKAAEKARLDRSLKDLETSDRLDPGRRWFVSNACIRASARHLAGLMMEREGDLDGAIASLRGAVTDLQPILMYAKDHGEIKRLREEIGSTLERLDNR